MIKPVYLYLDLKNNAEYQGSECQHVHSVHSGLLKTQTMYVLISKWEAESQM